MLSKMNRMKSKKEENGKTGGKYGGKTWWISRWNAWQYEQSDEAGTEDAEADGGKDKGIRGKDL